MVQGGGFEPGMKQKQTHAPIENEANNGLKNDKYTLAMARTSDPHSATAQFFINVSNNDFLNFTAPTPNGWGYAVFGTVTEGTDVVDKIKGVKTGNKGFHQNVPNEDVIIERPKFLNKIALTGPVWLASDLHLGPATPATSEPSWPFCRPRAKRARCCCRATSSTPGSATTRSASPALAGDGVEGAARDGRRHSGLAGARQPRFPHGRGTGGRDRRQAAAGTGPAGNRLRHGAADPRRRILYRRRPVPAVPRHGAQSAMAGRLPGQDHSGTPGHGPAGARRKPGRQPDEVAGNHGRQPWRHRSRLPRHGREPAGAWPHHRPARHVLEVDGKRERWVLPTGTATTPSRRAAGW